MQVLFLLFKSLFYCTVVRGQVADPPIPPNVVSEHAQDVLTSQDATSCDTAVGMISMCAAVADERN